MRVCVYDRARALLSLSLSLSLYVYLCVFYHILRVCLHVYVTVIYTEDNNYKPTECWTMALLFDEWLCLCQS